MEGAFFSVISREYAFKQLTDQTLDALIIGGGITGAGIAQDMASRGLRVGLIDKQDFAGGTSSRSTKLIHGGLRYLKQLEIGLVREVGRERSILYKNAPHLVTPEYMLLPIIKKGSLSKWMAAIALYIYEKLAGVSPEESRKMLSKEETEKREPLLDKDILKGGALYYEYRTDDARLVIDVLKTANSYGAICLNYAAADDFIYENNALTGLVIKDQLNDQKHTVKAKYIINAAGPWVDNLREKDHSLQGKRLHHTKGVHLVVPRHRLPLKQSIYFDTPDGRMIFAIPRAGTTYIGTTDTEYKKSLENPLVSKQDVAYLLKAVNTIFPTVHLVTKDITSTWAGLRPLIHQDGKSPSELSRKDEIFIAPSGLISIAGGKLTGYRMMAKRITDLVIKKLEAADTKTAFKKCSTDVTRLSGGAFSLSLSLNDFIEQMTSIARVIGADEGQVKSLVNKYGSHTNSILENAIAFFSENNDTGKSIILAELYYTIEHEMVITLNDFLIRRTGRLFFERETLAEAAPFILDEMAKIMKWSSMEKRNNWDGFQVEYMKVVDFR